MVLLQKLIIPFKNFLSINGFIFLAFIPLGLQSFLYLLELSNFLFLIETRT